MRFKKAFIFLAVVSLILMLDIWLKAYIEKNIAIVGRSLPVYPYGGIGVFRDWQGIDFCIVHVMNKGAAWGVFASLQHYLVYIRIAIIGGLMAYLWAVNASTYRKCALLLVVAGAIGNVIDYFLYGHVIDMFYFIFWGHSFPVFNIADCAISLGITLLLSQSLFKRSPKSFSRRSV